MPETTSGTVCLQGGGEFSPACRQLDADLLRAAAGSVVVSALAGSPGSDYRTATANGVRHFASLARSAGLDVEVLAAPDAREEPAAALAVLRRARLLVLPGGSPSRLLTALIDTGVDAIVRDLLADDGVVLGASAGAMVLCAWTVLPERGLQVVPGLGVVPGAVVLPHYTGGQRDWVRAVEAVVPTGTRLLGLPEESGVVLASGSLTAVGRSATAVLTSAQAGDEATGRVVIDVGVSRPW